MTTVNNDPTPELRRTFEPYGEAALMLVESLIHGLLASGALSIVEVRKILHIAVTSQVQIDRERRPDLSEPSTATNFLSAIASSLQIDALGRAIGFDIDPAKGA